MEKNVFDLNTGENNKPAKKNHTFLIVFLFFIGFLYFLLNSGAISIEYTTQTDDEETETETEIPQHMINSGEVFDKNGYIEFDGLKITYIGIKDRCHTFSVYNGNDFDVLLSMDVVGVKKDGSTEWLGSPGFCGYDLDTYEKEKEENGWAVKKTTNIIKSKDTLEEYASLYLLFSMGEGDSDYVGMDPDKDGYCDIQFTSYHQRGDGSVVTYTGAPESNLYRLIAK